MNSQGELSAKVNTSQSSASQPWWKSSVVYQLYPSSFADTTGNGVGDLNGITAKLDYIKETGADVLWLCPIYPSGGADGGYDISDYKNIDPRYGTLSDWDMLLEGTHKRGMKLMMDLVVNHTSDEHEWFRQSKEGGKDLSKNPKRDWYIWRKPRYDSAGNRVPPNNWKSVFQGSVWEYDEPSDEYYLHLYVAKQPDLNWENPKVREAVWDVMRFWINRGCDGFRMDVINLISKVPGLPDAPVVDPNDEFQPAFHLFANGPRVHEFIKQMNKEVLSKHDMITVGETPFTHDESQLAQFVLPRNHELNMVFQFENMDLDAPKGPDHDPLNVRPWKVPELGGLVNKWQTYKKDEDYWNAIFIENHDQARSVSRFGDDSDKYRTVSAKLLALLQITQGGTLYVYQGEELGMRNFPLSWGIEEYKDVATQNYWSLVLERRKQEAGGGEVDMSDVLVGAQKKARDHARTPMQWNAEKHAGFTTGTPWMRANDDYPEWNAAAQAKDPDSVWSFWKNVLRVRKENDVLIFGDFKHLNPTHEQVLAYTRLHGTSTAVVLLNFSGKEIAYSVDAAVPDGLKLLIGNYPVKEEAMKGMEVLLQPWEGRVYTA